MLTDAFLRPSLTQLSELGLLSSNGGASSSQEGVRFVTVPHPVQGLNKKEMERCLASVFDHMVRALEQKLGWENPNPNPASSASTSVGTDSAGMSKCCGKCGEKCGSRAAAQADENEGVCAT